MDRGGTGHRHRRRLARLRTRQDDLHGRPNAVTELGVEGAVSRLKDILAGAIASIPSLLAVIVLVPAIGLLLDLFLERTAGGVVTDEAIASFLLHP